MNTNNYTISLWICRQGQRPRLVLSLLLLLFGLVAPSSSSSSPINLFYCPEKTDGENGETYFKYTFKWQQTRAIDDTTTMEDPYIWRILIGDHDSAGNIPGMPAEATALNDLRPIDDLPFEFGFLKEFKNQNHGGWMIGYDVGFKHIMKTKWRFEELEEERPAVHEIAAGTKRGEGQVGTRRAMDEPIEQAATEAETQVAEQLPPINDAIIEDLEKFPVRAGPRGTIGWYPRGIGYSVTWTGRAENLVEDGNLYWTFMHGNIPKFKSEEQRHWRNESNKQKVAEPKEPSKMVHEKKNTTEKSKPKRQRRTMPSG